MGFSAMLANEYVLIVPFCYCAAVVRATKLYSSKNFYLEL